LKKQERIAIIGLAGFLIAYFCYQVAYGVEMTMGPNGTMMVGDMSPGSTISNVTGNATYGPTTINVGPAPFLDLLNTTWTMYNESSGSTSTIKFNDSTYTRTLHGNDLTGIWSSNVITAQQLQLCPSEQKWTSGCLLAILRVESPNQAEFMDTHGDRIHLMR
jgi:hypothetical protein